MVNKNKQIQSIVIFSLFLIVCSSFVSAQIADLKFNEKLERFTDTQIEDDLRKLDIESSISASQLTAKYSDLPVNQIRAEYYRRQIYNLADNYWSYNKIDTKSQKEILNANFNNADEVNAMLKSLKEQIIALENKIIALGYVDNSITLQNGEPAALHNQEINAIFMPGAALSALLRKGAKDNTQNTENINTNSQSRVSNNQLTNSPREIVNPPVEELIKKYRDLKVDHNTKKVSYPDLIDQTVENAVSSRALFDQAVGYMKIAEMHKKYLDIQKTTPLEKELKIELNWGIKEVSFWAESMIIPEQIMNYKCKYHITLENNTKIFAPNERKSINEFYSVLVQYNKWWGITKKDINGVSLYCYSSDTDSEKMPRYKAEVYSKGEAKEEKETDKEEKIDFKPKVTFYEASKKILIILEVKDKIKGLSCQYKVKLKNGKEINWIETSELPVIRSERDYEGGINSENDVASINFVCVNANVPHPYPIKYDIQIYPGETIKKPDFKPKVTFDDTKKEISIYLEVGDKIKSLGCFYKFKLKNGKSIQSIDEDNTNSKINRKMKYPSEIKLQREVSSINLFCGDRGTGKEKYNVQIYPIEEPGVCSTCGDNGRCTEKECEALNKCGWLAEGGATNFGRYAFSWTGLTAPMGSCKPLAVSKPPVTPEPVDPEPASTEIPEVPKDFTPLLTRAQATGKINKLYDSYGPAIEEAAAQSGINKYLIYGILSAETVGAAGSNPLAVSPSGAIGLMQITFTTGCSYADKCVNENNKEVQYAKKTESGGYKNYKIMNDPNLYPQIFDKITFCGDCARQEKDKITKEITKDYDCKIDGSNCNANKNNDGRFDAGLSIKAGAYILKDKMKIFKDYSASTELGIAAYNIGEGTVLNGIKLIPSSPYNINNPKQSTWLEIYALATEQNLVNKSGFFKNGRNYGLNYTNNVLTYAHIAESVLKDKPVSVASAKPKLTSSEEKTKLASNEPAVYTGSTPSIAADPEKVLSKQDFDRGELN